MKANYKDNYSKRYIFFLGYFCLLSLLLFFTQYSASFANSFIEKFDFGDAPDTYESIDDPARHLIDVNLYLGDIIPDEETAPQSSNNADGDNVISGSTINDEEGVISFPSLNTDNRNYSLIATVNNNSNQAANIYAWLDFDLDGEFDQDERAIVGNGNIILDINGKVPANSSGTVILQWTNIGNSGVNINEGKSYLRVRITNDELNLIEETSERDDASVGQANSGEVEDYSIMILSASTELDNDLSYCETIGGNITTANLFTEADNGTFGNGTAKNQVFPLSPSELTTYRYAFRYPPNDNTYVVSTHTDIRGFGTWHTPFGHTTGDENDRFLVVNANRNIIDTEMVQSGIISGLFPHTNYVFSAYILNLVGRNRNHVDPNVSFGIDLIGVDDDEDGTVDEEQEVEIRFITGDIPEQLISELGNSQPTWEQFAFLFNTGNSTSARFILRNNKLGGFGNDLAIDDITLTGCNLPSGNIEGVLYYDNNRNNIFDTQEQRLAGGNTIRLIDTKGTIDSSDNVIVSRISNSEGSYQFLNIPIGDNYQILAPDTDGIGNLIGTLNPRIDVPIIPNSTTSNQDFGYDSQASLILLKRITAINPKHSQEQRFNYFVNNPDDSNDDLPYWPDDKDNYLPGEIYLENVKPGDILEYSIYFLSNGQESSQNVSICDAIPDNMTFVKNSFGDNQGIGLGLNSSSLPINPNLLLSNTFNDDQGNFYIPGSKPPDQLCKKINPNNPQELVELDASNNTNGAVLVNLNNALPNANSSGTPPNSFGFIRFRTQIK